MYGYERSYRAGRAVTGWLEFVGWVIVIIGIILALAGFVTGGFMGIASRSFGNGDTPFIARIISMVPGILIVAGGLMSIMLAQHAKATMDTAEMTRELLKIARGEGSIGGDHQLSPTTNINNEITETYKGFNIVKIRDGYRAYGKEFESIDEAKLFLDGIKST